MEVNFKGIERGLVHVVDELGDKVGGGGGMVVYDEVLEVGKAALRRGYGWW